MFSDKNVALNNYHFFMASSINPLNGVTGIAGSITFNMLLDDGAFAPASGAISEVGLGWYRINITALERNGDVLVVNATGPGAVTWREVIYLDDRSVKIDAILANSRITSFRKNTALGNFTFTMRNASGDPVSGESVTAQRILDSGTVESMAGVVSEVGSSGVYRINIAAADTNCDFGAFIFSSTNTKTRTIHFKTIES